MNSERSRIGVTVAHILGPAIPASLQASIGGATPFNGLSASDSEAEGRDAKMGA